MGAHSSTTKQNAKQQSSNDGESATVGKLPKGMTPMAAAFALAMHAEQQKKLLPPGGCSTHYVLGTPLLGPWPEHLQKMVFANGCFWGSEKGIWRLPGGGIHSTAVGYSAGSDTKPSYRKMC